MPPDLIVFDCDGVLVDSEVIVIEVEADLLTAGGFPITADEIAERYVGLSYPDMMRGLEAQFGRTVPDSLSQEVQDRAMLAFEGRLRPVPGIPELLNRHQGPRCVASSSSPQRIDRSLGLTGLAHHFDPDHLFSATMVLNGKPAPDLFLHAADSLGVSPGSCLVIEDSPSGVTAARAAGMSVVGFVGGGHARPSLARRLADAGAPLVVDRADLLPLPS